MPSLLAIVKRNTFCVRLPIIQKFKAKGGKSMKRSLSLVLSLCFLFLLVGISGAEDMEKEKAEKEKPVEQKIEQKVSEATPAESKDMEKIVRALKGFNFGLLWYLSYQGGEEKNGTDFSRGVLKRGYLTVKKEFLPWFSARLTTDVTQVKDEATDSNGKVYSSED
jgi:hypothetical protein